MRRSLVAIAILGAVASAHRIPSHLEDLYHRNKPGTCFKKLSDIFHGGATYCGDVPEAIYVKGSDGNYDNMDIDCDGARYWSGECSNDGDIYGLGYTAFVDTVRTYGIRDLDTNVHPYVVFGNEGSNPSFDPRSMGMQPLSVMAVVCNGQLFYAVWGDTNDFTSTGEASLALGRLCFPKEIFSGNSTHAPKDVLYIGFIGNDAVPGAKGANWKTKNTARFQASIKRLGDKLVAGIPY
ncbi:Fungal chitosanase [Metarhizium album ARSEF 1941]|uniref:Endo-chitosanase n=1 Tax=Metarhizium album (strain ARSEF 1941) TaxID=1081103 RepID=A0A0B2WHS6_METAS|nr:Fungal chitosanase [Metarhizium album ARSEF 1941]KHN95581.1 Fungal chitosanase [Metarhizium album ARSEF 1941]